MATATYIPIATQTLGSAATSITFSSIPGTYTDLRLVLTCTTAASDSIELQLNGDTSTNYSLVYISGSGAAANSNNQTSNSRIRINFNGGTSTTVPTMHTVDFFSYAGATNKTLLSTVSGDLNGSGGVDVTVNLWRSTAAITSIKISCGSNGNLSTGTIATLFGI